MLVTIFVSCKTRNQPQASQTTQKPAEPAKQTSQISGKSPKISFFMLQETLATMQKMC